MARTEQQIRVCVVGCGGVSASHLSAYAENCLSTLISCVDLVDVCMPHDLHAPVSIGAARAGKHVSVEKPIANTLGGLLDEEADAMIAAAREAGV